MKIGLSYDVKQQVAQAEELPEDAFEEYDSPETIEALSDAIISAGHQVINLGGGCDFLSRVLREKPDLVFNIAEGLGNYRSREAQVPSVLEILGIPYSGSDPLTLALCLEKSLTKQLVAAVGVATPEWHVINTIEELENCDWSNFPFPVFIKPVHEGSSKGIRNASRVDDEATLKELVECQLRLYAQPVMVEQFISGDEVTVGLLGNGEPSVVGIMRVMPRHAGADFVYSLEVKRNWQEMVQYECPAKLDVSVMQRIEASCLLAFKTLGIRDLARMDFRVAKDGTPYFLEVNPLPGLNPKSGDFIIMSQAMGWSYEKLIITILNVAIERYSFGS
ncbi:MAG: ATP-grasp domain-containing protein [Dehalococcoidia bacterium]|nr:ATP-grasp domain-containing protein [Dehalococcoidia bacterium]